MKRNSLIDKTPIRVALKNLLGNICRPRYIWYRFQWHFFPLWNIVPSHPLHVDIETTDACNLRCSMCMHGQGGVTDTGFIDEVLCKKVIDECVVLGIYSIKFNYRGEPLLHPLLVDFIRYAKKNGIYEVQFNTNGLTMDDDKIQKLLQSGVDRIIFSVDGASRETYEAIRIGSDYDVVVNNITRLLQERKRLKRRKPIVRVQMVVDETNRHEVETFRRLWSEKGVNSVMLIEKQDRDSERGYPLKEGKPPIGRTFCDQPWQRLNVNRDGAVLICCGDWYRKVVVGNAHKDSLKTIWKSKRVQELRKIISQRRLNDIASCKTCFRTSTYRWS